MCASATRARAADDGASVSGFLLFAGPTHVYLSSRHLDGSGPLLRLGDLPCRRPAAILDDVLVTCRQRENGNLPVSTVGRPALSLLDADNSCRADVDNAARSVVIVTRGNAMATVVDTAAARLRLSLADDLVPQLHESPEPPRRLTDEQRKFAAQYERAAFSSGWRAYCRSGRLGHVDDWIDAADFGLVEAARSLDPVCGFTFNTFLTPCVRQRIWTLHQRLEPSDDGLTLRFDEVFRDHLAIVFEPEETRTLPAEEQMLEEEVLAMLRDRLPARYWELLASYYLDQQSAQAIGAKRGMSGRTVRLRLRIALRRARRLISA